MIKFLILSFMISPLLTLNNYQKTSGIVLKNNVINNKKIKITSKNNHLSSFASVGYYYGCHHWRGGDYDYDKHRRRDNDYWKGKDYDRHHRDQYRDIDDDDYYRKRRDIRDIKHWCDTYYNEYSKNHWGYYRRDKIDYWDRKYWKDGRYWHYERDQYIDYWKKDRKYESNKKIRPYHWDENNWRRHHWR